MTADELKKYILGKLDFALSHRRLLSDLDAWLVSCAHDWFSTDDHAILLLLTYVNRPHETEPALASGALDFTSVNWQEAVLDNPLPVLVCFFASWCHYCQALHPKVEDLAQRLQGQAAVGFLNTDEYPGLTHQYHVRGLPTCVVFRAGREVERKEGDISIEELSALLDVHPSLGNPVSRVPEEEKR